MVIVPRRPSMYRFFFIFKHFFIDVQVEPDATREMVTKKVNSLRSSRCKEKNKVKNSLKSGAGAADIYHPSLWYYDLLEFVDDQETPRYPVSNFNETLESEVNTLIIK